MKQLIVDCGLNPGELPDLSVLKNDFQHPCVFAVAQGLNLGIVNRNMRNGERSHEVLAVVDLSIAFAAEDHEVEHTEQVFAMTTSPLSAHAASFAICSIERSESAETSSRFFEMVR